MCIRDRSLKDLEDLEERAKKTSAPGGRIYNPGWHQALEIDSMIEVSRMCALSALKREESRGGHTREDFPNTDKNFWSKVNIRIVLGEDGEMKLDHTTYPPIPDELKKLLDSDDLEEE